MSKLTTVSARLGDHGPGGPRPFVGSSLALARRLSAGALAVGALTTCFVTVDGSSALAATRHVTTRPATVLSASQSTAASPTQDVAAFAAAGYGYTDALDLAALWSLPSIYSAKVSAGAKLWANHQLPFTPGGGTHRHYTTAQDMTAYLLSGGDYPEALDLAAVWAAPTIGDAKVTAGAKLLADTALPKIPKTFTKAQDIAAFTASGYDHHDALNLAAVWAAPTIGDAKVTAGAKLLADTALPKIPKTFTKAQDIAAFTASGYDHHDAVHLARLWHTGSVHAAKVKAGTLLLAGSGLPIRP